MENIDKQIEEINQIIVNGFENRDFIQIKRGISELKNVLKSIYDEINQDIEYNDEAPFVLEVIPHFQKINDILQNFLTYIEEEKFSETDIEELKNLENELQEIIETVETIMEIPEVDEDDDNEMNIEEEVEKIMKEDLYNEDLEENFDIEDTGDDYLNKIFHNINTAIEEEDDDKILSEVDKLSRYVEKAENEEEE
ncbi:MAG: hypothetical protein NZM44_04160 [Candidatus Calescibacterium sp.]|nr:hypothetical protein [Candidatus Calescibacterium sp.]